MATGCGRARRRAGVWLALALVSALGAAAATAAVRPPRALHAVPVTPAAATGAKAWWRAGFAGRGVDVAVVDTGVAPVAGLSSSVVKGPDLAGRGGATGARDGYGHGTFVASLVHGVAPAARIVDVKVGAADGSTDAARVVAGIDWVVRHAHEGGLDIRVLNLSLGTRPDVPPELDPVAAAAENAWRHGIVVVAAAGNDGHAGLADPADATDVVAVGAADARGTATAADDAVAPYSSEATTPSQRHPDLVAPGSHLLGLRVPGSLLDRSHPDGRVGDRFFRGSGTSEAAALVSGATALVLQRYPQLSPAEVKAFLARGAVRLDAPAAAQGAGELRLPRLLRLVPERRPVPRRPGHRVPTPAVQPVQSGDVWAGSSWTSESWLGSTWGLH